MTHESEFDALLADLYGGIADPERLESFLGRLNLASGSHITALIRQDAVNPAGNSFLAPGLDASVMARYEADFTGPGDKLWFERTLHVTKTGSVIDGDAWVSKDELLRTRYYADVLSKVDTMHSVAMCGALTPTRAAFITPCRSERAGAYDAGTMQLLERVNSHWVNAYGLMVRFEALAAKAELAASHNHAMFLLDEQLKWIGGNPSAERMVAAGWWRGRAGGRLEAVSALTRKAWEAAQRSMSGSTVQPDVVIPIHDAKAHLVAFARLQRYGASFSGEGLPAFVLFVRPLQAPGVGDIARQLSLVFGLTRAETALAEALRECGEVKGAASTVGISLASARSRLQSIFEKTSTHRQVELLRMMDVLAAT